jgi:hypothetical protein
MNKMFDALREAERFMAYFAGETGGPFVGPGTPQSCLVQIRSALSDGWVIANQENLLGRLRAGAASTRDHIEWRSLTNEGADEIEKLRNQLVKAHAVLEQCQDCIRGETPEDMTDQEAREDTISKIREIILSDELREKSK